MQDNHYCLVFTHLQNHLLQRIQKRLRRENDEEENEEDNANEEEEKSQESMEEEENEEEDNEEEENEEKDLGTVRVILIRAQSIHVRQK